MPEQTQKTATGLSRLSEINTGIDKLLNAPAPSVDASTLPKPSAVPAEPPQMQDTSFATKLARSMSIFLAAQQNPENGMQLIKQYEAQDAAARDAVQQRFANATALAQMEQQRLQFSEDIRAGRMNETQATIDNPKVLADVFISLGMENVLRSQRTEIYREKRHIRKRDRH